LIPEPAVLRENGYYLTKMPPTPPPQENTEDQRVFWDRVREAISDMSTLLRIAVHGPAIIDGLISFAYKQVVYVRQSNHTPVARVKSLFGDAEGERVFLGIPKVLTALLGQLAVLRTCYRHEGKASSLMPVSEDEVVMQVSAECTNHVTDLGMQCAALVMRRAVSTTFRCPPSSGETLMYSEPFLQQMFVLFMFDEDEVEDVERAECAVETVDTLIEEFREHRGVVPVEKCKLDVIVRVALFGYVTGMPCGKLRK